MTNGTELSWSACGTQNVDTLTEVVRSANCVYFHWERNQQCVTINQLIILPSLTSILQHFGSVRLFKRFISLAAFHSARRSTSTAHEWNWVKHFDRLRCCYFYIFSPIVTRQDFFPCNAMKNVIRNFPFGEWRNIPKQCARGAPTTSQFIHSESRNADNPQKACANKSSVVCRESYVRTFIHGAASAKLIDIPFAQDERKANLRKHPSQLSIFVSSIGKVVRPT